LRNMAVKFSSRKPVPIPSIIKKMAMGNKLSENNS